MVMSLIVPRDSYYVGFIIKKLVSSLHVANNKKKNVYFIVFFATLRHGPSHFSDPKIILIRKCFCAGSNSKCGCRFRFIIISYRTFKNVFVSKNIQTGIVLIINARGWVCTNTGNRQNRHTHNRVITGCTRRNFKTCRKQVNASRTRWKYHQSMYTFLQLVFLRRFLENEITKHIYYTGTYHTTTWIINHYCYAP